MVIISALDGTFQRTGFENIINLIPTVEKVKKLAAICKICGQNASFTFRTCLNESVQLIGGGEVYMPLCRECFNKEHTKQELQKEKLLKKQQAVDSSEGKHLIESPDLQEDVSSNDSSNDNSPLK